MNFFVKVVDKQQLRSNPGFYGYRAGYYGTWTGYPYVETIEYREGTLSIAGVGQGVTIFTVCTAVDKL